MKRVISLAVVVGALAVALALGAGAAAAAGAHGGDGVLEVEAAHPTSTGVHFIVQLTYQNDGDAVPEAAVTATPTSPSGEELAPVTLTPVGDGSYQGAVDLPDTGRWTVRFASDEPPATLEETAEMAATTTPSATPADGEDGDSGGFAPADDGTGGSAASDGDSGSDGVPILLVVAAAVVAIGGVITALRIVLRTRGAQAPSPSPTEPTTTDAEAAEGSTGAGGPAGGEGKTTGSPAPGGGSAGTDGS